MITEEEASAIDRADLDEEEEDDLEVAEAPEEEESAASVALLNAAIAEVHEINFFTKLLLRIF